MREWHGFTSYDPRAMAETIDRAMREISASIKRIKRGQQPSGSGDSLALAVVPPAESALTQDGNEVTPSGRLARVDLTNPASPTSGTLYDTVPIGAYRVTFGAHITAVPTTSALTVKAIFNTGDECDLVTSLNLVSGTYVHGSATFPTNLAAPVEYEITYTNSMDMAISLVLEAL